MSQPTITDAGCGFHLLTKPVGPVCNLACRYCFYLEKKNLYPGENRWRMSAAVLEEYIRQYIQSQPTPEIHFAWQGGEPTLAGADFFRRAVALQKKHAGGKTIFNSLQTNGTRLDDAGCEFLAANHFLVGISVDGPAELHDPYRVDRRQQPTWGAVMRGVERLKKHGVEFNTLTVVHRVNSQQPLAVYRFLKSIGSPFLQFIPLVERAMPAAMNMTGHKGAAPRRGGRSAGLRPGPIQNATPPAGSETAAPALVTPESVGAEDYGNFLCAIFDEWVRHDVGQTFVQMFDAALGSWMGLGSSFCVFAETCGRALAIEHNGDVFSCDHYVDPPHRLGNVMSQSLGAMVNSPPQIRFGRDKLDLLPKFCRACAVRFACHGECPKHRFIPAPDGEAGLNYLCAAYQKFFHHIAPAMRGMAWLLQNNQAPARIMQMMADPPPARTARP